MGYIAGVDPEGKAGRFLPKFRNQFDIAFNQEGELFTSGDADMEWDAGFALVSPAIESCHLGR
ncbi:MAG: hypothetical protein R3C12_23015 [Planctomycetaceae bacterium]